MKYPYEGVTHQTEVVMGFYENKARPQQKQHDIGELT